MTTCATVDLAVGVSLTDGGTIVAVGTASFWGSGFVLLQATSKAQEIIIAEINFKCMVTPIGKFMLQRT